MAAIDVVNVAAYVDASIDLAQDFQNYTNDPTSQNYATLVNSVANYVQSFSAFIPDLNANVAASGAITSILAAEEDMSANPSNAPQDITTILGDAITLLGVMVEVAGLATTPIDGFGLGGIELGYLLTQLGGAVASAGVVKDLGTIESYFSAINSSLRNMANSLGSMLSGLMGDAQNQVVDPLVLSMNGQAVTTTSLANGNYVDFQGTGFEEQTSWFSSNAGILVDVTNPDGTLNNGFTIIGSSATNQNGNALGEAGFTQLAALAPNNNGVINSSDSAYNQVEIWVDSNGQPGSGHLETLAQAGITSISLSTTAVNTTDANGDTVMATSAVTYANGTTGTLADENLAVNTVNTIDESAGVTNSTYANLPNIAGSGDVHSLQVAMALDTTGTLASLVQQYLAATPAQQASLISNLIFTWTGVQNDPQVEAYHFIGDTREIDALSKFVGAQYTNNSSWSTTLVTLWGVPMIQEAWDRLVSYVSGCLLSSGLNQTLLSDVSFTLNATTQTYGYDVSTLVAALGNLSNTQVREFGNFLSGSSQYNGIVAALNAYFPNPSNAFQDLISVLGTSQQDASLTASSTTYTISAPGEVYVAAIDDTVNFDVTGMIVNVTGVGNTLNINNSTINASNASSSPSDLTVSGDGNTITGSDLSPLYVSGSDTLSGSNDTVTLEQGTLTLASGSSNDTVTLEQGTLTLASGSGNDTVTVTGTATLNGSNAAVTLEQGTLTLANSGDTVSGTGSVVLANANMSETVGGNSGTVDVTAQASGDTLTLAGDYGTLNQVGGSAWQGVSVTGSSDTLNLASTGETVSVTGAWDNLNLTGGTINASSSSDLTVNGTGNTIDASGATNLKVTGTATLNGSNDTVTLEQGTLTLASGSGANTVTASNGALDTLSFAGVSSQDLWFSRVGNNLLITVDGTQETETVSNWFSGTQYQVGVISDGYGATAAAAGINALVQAMASMTPPPLGQTTLSTTQAQQLAPVLAANWQ